MSRRSFMSGFRQQQETSHATSASRYPPAFNVLGVRVDAVQIPEVIRQMEVWIARRGGCRYIAVTGMHGITEAQHDSSFRTALKNADLVVPDGMPLVWLGRLRGCGMKRRVYGPELMTTFCRETAARGHRHFLYGGDAGVAERLSKVLARTCPGIHIVGVYAPPFRELTPEEDAHIVETIAHAAPDMFCVGLSTPIQGYWIHDHRER